MSWPLSAVTAAQDAYGNVSGVVGYNGPGVVIERRPAMKKDNFFKKRFAVVDDMAAAVSGTARWTRFTGTSVLVNSPDHALTNLGCANTLKITTISSFDRVQAALKAAITLNVGVTVVPVYISEMPTDYSTTPPTYQAAAVQIMFGTELAFTNNASFSFSSSQFLRQGWNYLMVNALDTGTLNSTGAGLVYAGTAAAGSSYTHVRIILSGLQPYAGITPVVHVGGVFQNGKAQANVLLGFDDCHQDSVDLVNLFQQYEIPTYLAVVTGSIGTGNYMTVDQLRAAYNRGTDLIPHTTDHVVLDTVSVPVAKADIAAARKAMVDWGFVRTVEVMAYPQNVSNDRIFTAAAEAGHVMGRWSKPAWLPTAMGIDNPRAVGSRDLGGKTLAQAELLLDSAEAYGCTQVIYAHQIATKAVQSMTHSAGVVTVGSTAHNYSNGHLVHHRGFAQPEYNVAGIVENATTNGYTFKATGITVATATQPNAGGRSFSPDFPASGGAAPANSLYWYWSDYVAYAQEISDRVTAGTLSAISFSQLLDRCRV